LTKTLKKVLTKILPTFAVDAMEVQGINSCGKDPFISGGAGKSLFFLKKSEH